MESTDAPPHTGAAPHSPRLPLLTHARLNPSRVQRTRRFAPVIDFTAKSTKTSLVKIEVANHAGAYVLFESLNDRGVPSPPSDPIKNKVLARLERDDPQAVKLYFPQVEPPSTTWATTTACRSVSFASTTNAFHDRCRVDRSRLPNAPTS